MSADASIRNRRRAWLGGALALVLLLVFVSTSVEWVEEAVDLGYSAEARRNPLLAAELYLKADGIEAESVTGLDILDDLPPPGDVLIMTASRRALSEARAGALETWVWEGGHLVVVAEGLYDMEADHNPDDLMGRFGLYLRDCDEAADLDENPLGGVFDPDESEEQGDDSIQGDSDDADRDEQEGADEDPSTVEIGELIRQSLSAELPVCWDEDVDKSQVSIDGAPEAEIEMDSCQGIYAYGEEIPEDEDALVPQIAGGPDGLGSFTAAGSLSILNNDRIHCADHAYLLGGLARRGGKTWLLADPDIPALTTLIWSAAPLLCTSFAIWLLVWAASRSLAVGLHARDGEPPRRELLEHLEAS
ncbi:MAG: DUF4350 domain-containing protein, partial [bacterium]|nr:DUF4350 domain-containing protein [bacterium]